MISITIPKLEQNELEDRISKIPKIWKKHRGIGQWGLGLKLISTIRRQFDTQSLTIFEFTFTLAGGTPRLVAIFLGGQDSNGWQVLIYGPRLLENKVKETFLHAFHV